MLQDTVMLNYSCKFYIFLKSNIIFQNNTADLIALKQLQIPIKALMLNNNFLAESLQII